MSFGYPHVFETRLERHGVGRTRKLWYNVVFLPVELVAELPFRAHPRLRVEGEIADLPIEGAWMPTGDGRRYLIVAPRLLQEAGVAIGDLVEVRLRVADQDAVDMPPELAAALAAHADARTAWDGLCAGKRRVFAHRVSAAKSPATRARRVAEVMEVLKDS